MLAGCASAPTPQQIAATDYGPYPVNFQDIVKGQLRVALRDPYSAVYEYWIGPTKGYWGNRTLGYTAGYAVCVGVNSKNAFGGYGGTTPYFFVIRDGRVVASETDEDEAAAACSQLRIRAATATPPKE